MFLFVMYNLWVLSIKTPLPLTRCSLIALNSVDLYPQFCDTKLLWTLSNKRLFAPYNQDQLSHHVGWTKQDLIIFKTFHYFSHFAYLFFYSHFISLKCFSHCVCPKFLWRAPKSLVRPKLSPSYSNSGTVWDSKHAPSS